MDVWHLVYETCHGGNSALCLWFWTSQVELLKSMCFACVLSTKSYIYKHLNIFQIYCYISMPSDVLKNLNMPVNMYWFNFLAVSAIYLLLKVVTYLVLRKKLQIHWYSILASIFFIWSFSWNKPWFNYYEIILLFLKYVLFGFIITDLSIHDWLNFAKDKKQKWYYIKVTITEKTLFIWI